MHDLRAVIFDMDGVLIDSEPIADRIITNLAAEAGITIPAVEIAPCRGMTGNEFWARMIETYHLPQSLEYYRSRMKEEMELYSPELAPPGLVRLLGMLNRSDIKLAMGTSGSRSRMQLVLSTLGIEDAFDAKVSGDDVTKSKPDPMVFLQAANVLGSQPANCMVIEDGSRGIEAAKTAGMTAVGYTGLSATADSLSEADELIKTFEGVDVDVLQGIHASAQT